MKYTILGLAAALLAACGIDPQVQADEVSGSEKIGSNAELVATMEKIGSNAELVATVNFDQSAGLNGHRIPLSWTPHGGTIYAAIRVPQGYEDGRYGFMARMPNDEKTLVTVEQVLLDAQLHELKRSTGTINVPSGVSWVSGVPLFVDGMQKGTHYLLVRDVADRPLSMVIDATASPALPPFDPDLPDEEPW